METDLKCSVCFASGALLKNTCDTDHNNIKWSYKLRLCVPEVDWLEDYLICKRCTNQLDTAYEFRDQCLKSFALRNCLNKGNNHLSTAPPVIYQCKSCPELLKNSSALVHHNAKVHCILNDRYHCASCEKVFKTSLEQIHHEITHFGVCGTTNTDNKERLDLDNSKIEPTGEGLMEEPLESNLVFNCFNCGELFYTKALLVSHLDMCKVLNSNQNKSINNIHAVKQLDCRSDEVKCLGTEEEMENKTVDSNNDKDCPEDLGNSESESATESKDVSQIPVSIEKKLSTLRPKKRARKKLDQTSNTCPVCSMVFNTRYLAKRHVRNVHATEKNYHCDKCEQKFASPVYLNAHKRYHSGERPHICSFCGKGFITGSDLYHHEKIHANKRAYKCEKCSKAFNTSSDLHKHKLCVHLDRSQWKYVCNLCDRRFPLKTNLDAHIKTHTGERNFACHLCDRKCVNRSVLMRHVKSHSNVCLFKCSLCKLEYKYQKSLDIHMTKTHGIGDAKIPERIKKYFCHICPKSYFANNKLQKHIRTHTGERPFSCQICEKRFIDKSYVKQHLKTAHNISFSQLDT